MEKKNRQQEEQGSRDYPIQKYISENQSDIFEMIGQDPEWEFLIESEQKKELYSQRLQDSATFVCYSSKSICGYIRAIIDEGMALYISELYVAPPYRNCKVGERLMQALKDSTSLTVYALSDEDDYYKKKDFKKIGSVFEL
jgi:ribosomal protein S18 acetylase RimI-like enzyme